MLQWSVTTASKRSSPSGRTLTSSSKLNGTPRPRASAFSRQFLEQGAGALAGGGAVGADGEDGGPVIGRTGGEEGLQLARHRRLVADDGGVGRPGDAAPVEDPLVVGQLAVHGEVLGRRGAGLLDVVVDGDGQPGHDAGGGPAGGLG